MTGKTPKDDFWMMLKAVPVIISVIYLHQIYPLAFSSAILFGVPTGFILSWCLIPLTRRLMATRYAPVLDERLNERPVDAGCSAYLFIFFLLLGYQAVFVMAPQQRAKNLAKKKAQQTPAQDSHTDR
jgi:hypothetical protein